MSITPSLVGNQCCRGPEPPDPQPRIPTAPASQVTSAVPQPSVPWAQGGGASRWHSVCGTAPPGLGMSSTCPHSASHTIPWAHPLTSSLGTTRRSQRGSYCSDPTHCHLWADTDALLSSAHFLPLFCKPVQAAARPHPAPHTLQMLPHITASWAGLGFLSKAS